jgi:hypothetical protein
MLRRINLHDLGSGTFDIPENIWPRPGKTEQRAKGMPTSYGEAVACVTALKAYGLVEGYYSDKGYHVRTITGAGRECLWELDHPDIPAKLRDWARRSPWASCVIIAALTIGAA